MVITKTKLMELPRGPPGSVLERWVTHASIWSFTLRKHKINNPHPNIWLFTHLLEFLLITVSSFVLFQNGYPRGMLLYTLPRFWTDKRTDPLDLPQFLQKVSFWRCPVLGFQTKAQSCQSKFYGSVNLRVIFKTICRGKFFIPYKKNISAALKIKNSIQRYLFGLWFAVSVKSNNDSIIGRLSISKLLHKVFMSPLLQTMWSLLVKTSSEMILKSLLLANKHYRLHNSESRTRLADFEPHSAPGSRS